MHVVRSFILNEDWLGSDQWSPNGCPLRVMPLSKTVLRQCSTSLAHINIFEGSEVLITCTCYIPSTKWDTLRSNRRTGSRRFLLILQPTKLYSLVSIFTQSPRESRFWSTRNSNGGISLRYTLLYPKFY